MSGGTRRSALGSWSAARCSPRWRWSAPTSPPAAPPTRRRRPRTRASTGPGATPAGPAGDRRAVLALGARRRRLQARRQPRDAGPGAGHDGRARALQPALRDRRREAGEGDPRRPGAGGRRRRRGRRPQPASSAARCAGRSNRSRSTRRSNWSGTPPRPRQRPELPRPGRRPARRTPACRGAAGGRSAGGRAPDPEHRQRLQRQPRPQRPAGMRFRSRPRTCSGFTAMWTLAGKTAASSASSHQRPKRRLAGCRTASAPAISATPLTATTPPCAGQRRRHDRLVGARDDEVHRPGEGEEAARALRERVTPPVFHPWFLLYLRGAWGTTGWEPREAPNVRGSLCTSAVA